MGEPTRDWLGGRVNKGRVHKGHSKEDVLVIRDCSSGRFAGEGKLLEENMDGWVRTDVLTDFPYCTDIRTDVRTDVRSGVLSVLSCDRTAGPDLIVIAYAEILIHDPVRVRGGWHAALRCVSLEPSHRALVTRRIH